MKGGMAGHETGVELGVDTAALEGVGPSAAVVVIVGSLAVGVVSTGDVETGSLISDPAFEEVGDGSEEVFVPDEPDVELDPQAVADEMIRSTSA